MKRQYILKKENVHTKNSFLCCLEVLDSYFLWKYSLITRWRVHTVPPYKAAARLKEILLFVNCTRIRYDLIGSQVMGILLTHTSLSDCVQLEAKLALTQVTPNSILTLLVAVTGRLLTLTLISICNIRHFLLKGFVHYR